MPIWTLLLPFLVHYGMTVQVHLEPSANSCLCQENVTYTCHVNLGHSLTWNNIWISNDLIYQSLHEVGALRVSENVTTSLISRKANENDKSLNLTSTLEVRNFDLNNTELFCKGAVIAGIEVEDSNNATVTICITGNSSGPANMSVEWSLTSVATVQFHLPAYGAECVADYIVKAVREEEMVMCNSAHTDQMYMYTYTCSVSGNNGTAYIFTADAITPGPAGTQYHVNTSIDCWFPFPEKIRISEAVCGPTLRYDISWDGEEPALEKVMVSWGKSQETYVTSEAEGKGFHQLNLSYDMTGIIEVAVTFLSNDCAKQDSISFEVQRVIINVSFSAENRTLTILTRDCFDGYYNFTASVTYTITSGMTMSKRFSLLPNLVVHLEKQVEYAAFINFTVTIIEDASGVTVDQFHGRYVFTVQNNGSDEGEGIPAAYIAVGVSVGSVVLGGILVLVAVVAAVVGKRKHNKTLKENKQYRTEKELNTLDKQPVTETESKQDYPGPMYAELNTSSRKLECMSPNHLDMEKEKTKQKSSIGGVTYTEVEIRSTTQPPPQMDQEAEYADIKHNGD